MQECIEPYLNDTEDAWMLKAGGEYQQLNTHGTNTKSAQKQLIKRYSGD